MAFGAVDGRAVDCRTSTGNCGLGILWCAASPTELRQRAEPRCRCSSTAWAGAISAAFEGSEECEDLNALVYSEAYEDSASAGGDITIFVR